MDPVELGERTAVTAHPGSPSQSLGGRTALDRWPTPKTVYLTLDLECDYGTALASNEYHAAGQAAQLAGFLDERNLPLTCFLQTEILEAVPDAAAALERAGVPVEFHAHSHTHLPHGDADIEYEVSESVRRVRDRFDVDSVGYRFPDGAADESDYRTLAANDVPFNASLFPSWRPNRFDNTDQPVYPFRDDATGVVELPFTVLSESVRIPVSLSYLKLLGRPFEWLVRRRPPSAIVFDLHMHDLVVPPTFDDLSPAYRAIYARRKRAGFAVLDRFVTGLRRQGYSFDLLSSLYEQTMGRLTDHG